MEHLQRQQEGKLEMNMQEKQLLQAQLMFAHHSNAAARASGTRPDSQTYPATQPALNSHFLHQPDDEEEETDEEEEQEVADPEDHNDVEEDEQNGEESAKRARVQQVAGFPFAPYPRSQFSALKQMAESSLVKQEHEEKTCSPVGQQVFTSPGDLADWGYDEQLKQVSLPPFHPAG